MMRYVLAFVAVVLQAYALRAAEAQLMPPEIGYIEDFDQSPNVYVLKTGGTRRNVAILAPIFNGDTIEVINPSATLTLRKVGQEGPVVLSMANNVATITAKIPEKAFWVGVFNWTASVVQLFDREQRDRVSASIRGDAEEKLSAPLFSQPQTVLAGRRKLVLGWLAPRAVEIRVVDGDGAQVASGRGSGKLWVTPEIDWKPGAYTIELLADGEALRQGIQFIAMEKWPTTPSELANPDVPQPLRAAAVGAWYAANDPTFLLEALQHVAPEARASRPARLLTAAFIAGKRPPPLP
jgi:hypothetical protein